ncbi:MAG: hypothetical protein DCC43_03525 [Candidatus Brocadia sp.]|jgi:hypothetical protein|uniref:Lipoprotein n=1 Tax=Candidatus Brocadia fulgida TaxID=380242 RepID=A0A0M2V179_9BACT|nr:MAG: hypothetical protein BROFUL_00805 [Candidatus Brocadia fulgida]MCE7911178.1 hypothetical protein [Candidatus Brocadia sp. AMX3]MDG5997262.1 hypothetical protein [Candidatus Brocadia sp.]OQZ01643.1 MAG: hypothetical protein B6D35_02490 [Candidatus Brocadia sp. UTAMX2]MBV6518321.1 hypothetical protein [Candidatus Brocadia fulgida]
MNLSIIPGKGLCISAVVSMMLAGGASSGLFAGEHPEHPRGGYAAVEQKPRVTREDVAKFAEEYVGKNSREGIFKYLDITTGKELELMLEQVHKDKLSPTKADEYFVCADFSGKDGNRYDLDFFVQGADKSSFRIDKSAIAVHKINGKENYAWSFNKKRDLWERKAIIIEKDYPESPKKEHPG